MQEPCAWDEIASLYAALGQLTDSPVVELNRAIAVAEIDGPEAGLALVDQLALHDYRYFHSTRANLLRRLGRDSEAREEYTFGPRVDTDRARASAPSRTNRRT